MRTLTRVHMTWVVCMYSHACLVAGVRAADAAAAVGVTFLECVLESVRSKNDTCTLQEH